ncbi:hypothetical protein CLV80_10499 [Yoonia maritima]|uniref:Uncharacterized protein n=1 Tax=Yoonia maritima TaxID=1435347 RepID=A0A2T0W001_9RHOB|nr:hypothetical protein CLV80_10499 [Yoonia maritima]
MLDVVLIALLSVVVVIGSPLSNARGQAAVQLIVKNARNGANAAFPRCKNRQP